MERQATAGSKNRPRRGEVPSPAQPSAARQTWRAARCLKRPLSASCARSRGRGRPGLRVIVLLAALAVSAHAQSCRQDRAPSQSRGRRSLFPARTHPGRKRHREAGLRHRRASAQEGRRPRSRAIFPPGSTWDLCTTRWAGPTTRLPPIASRWPPSPMSSNRTSISD